MSEGKLLERIADELGYSKHVTFCGLLECAKRIKKGHDRYEKIRKGALKLARIIEETTPDNVGREAAICALEMVVMTANKAIALERFKRV